MFPESVRRWLTATHGAATAVVQLPSSQGEVWRVRVADACEVAVKRSAPSVIDRELWGLEMAAGDSVPSVLVRPVPEVVVLSWCPGSPSTKPAAMRAAGAWLRRFHNAARDVDDPMDLQDALCRRRDGWLARAASDIPVAAVASLDFREFRGRPRVACHRDFTPANWLWDDERGLTVLDFGQSRFDVSTWDLVKLTGGVFAESPDAEVSFYEGYGELDDAERRCCSALTLLHGLQTAVWGDTHQDAEFSARGRELLANAGFSHQPRET